MGGVLVDGAVKELLDESKLPVAADERRLETLGLQRPSRTGHNPQCSEERVEPALALELVRSGVLVGDGLLCRTPRRLSDVDRAGWGDRLDPRRGVDEVAGHHSLALGSERDGRLSRKDAGAGPELFGADLIAERRDGGDE